MYTLFSKLSFAIVPLGTIGICTAICNQKWDASNSTKSYPRPSYMQWKHFSR